MNIQHIRKKDTPLWLVKTPGIGGTLAARLVRQGVRTHGQLRAMLDQLPAKARAFLRHRIQRAIPLPVGQLIAAELRHRLVFMGPSGLRKYPIRVTGSIRRGAPCSKDIDLLVIVPDDMVFRGVLASVELREDPQATLSIVEVYAPGARRRSFIVQRVVPEGRRTYYAVDLFLASIGEKPFALFHYSSGRDYNIRVRAHVKKRGYRLNQYGIYMINSGRRAPGSEQIKTEKDLAAFMGVTYHPHARTPNKSQRSADAIE